MEKILTVVIPAYNIEKYVVNCLGSFVQKEILEDIEVLLVNDGSGDRTRELAEKFVDRYPETFRIVDKKNGGHGSTINRGIQEASGTYFKVVDGDDWVDGPAFVNLVRFLKNSSSDFVITRYCWVQDASGKRKLEFQEPFKGVVYGKEYCFSEISGKVFLKMHAVTVRTEILRRIPLIDEKCYYVDMEYVLFPIPYVKKVTFLPDIVYQYRIGLANQSMNMKSMQKNEVNYTRVLDRMFLFYKEQTEKKASRECLEYLENCLGRMVATRFKIYLSFPYDRKIQDKIKEFDQNLKKQYPKIYAAVINKPVILMRKSNYRLYPMAQKLFQMQERAKKR